MRRGLLVIAMSLLVAGGGGLAYKTRSEAHRLVTNPREIRMMPRATPADRGLAFEDVELRTDDGFTLAGWFVPSWNGATVMLVHGYKDSRANLLGVAQILHRHGYNTLLISLRAHDTSDGETITFGHEEMRDLQAAFTWLTARASLDAARIGIFGVSMGGTIAIRYASENPRVRAVIADCAFSSLEDTIETSVRFFTGLPPFPFAPMIEFWTERHTGIRAEDIDAKAWIARLSPRPVFLLQGGADVVISAESGARLFAAAGEPKELWLEPALGHAQFLATQPAEFERRVVSFYHRHLTGSEPGAVPASPGGTTVAK
jgi:pimeloyl-ACP methyl ester carboxylesterase